MADRGRVQDEVLARFQFTEFQSPGSEQLKVPGEEKCTQWDDGDGEDASARDKVALATGHSYFYTLTAITTLLQGSILGLGVSRESH